MRIHAKTLCLMGRNVSNQILTVENGYITSIETGTGGDLCAQYVSPGLFDMHIHGGYGYHVMSSGEEELGPWLDTLFQNGVTGVLPSVYTGSIETMRDAVRRLRGGMKRQACGDLQGALIAGIHLEGPFINRERPGAMDARSILPPMIELFEEITDGISKDIRLVTLAPEVGGCEKLISHLRALGITVQAGHTDATFDQARRAFLAGVSGVCHFFNGVRGIHHREPGILTAALLDDSVYCELIADMVHVHPAAAELVIRNKGYNRTVLISDAIKTTGLSDGTYLDDGLKVIVKQGINRTEDGGLCGGGCYLNGCVGNLVKRGIPPEKAMHMASNTARMALGIGPVTLYPGSVADLTGMDENFEPQFTLAGSVLWERRR